MSEYSLTSACMVDSTEAAAPSAWPQIDRSFSKRAVFLMSIVFYGVILPLNWVLTRLGFQFVLVSVMNRARARGRFEKVFQGYTPAHGDVFVCTFAKSGTNWMMQIAHQIAFRGAGEYAHIHDVISWPDMVLVSSYHFAAGVAGPLMPTLDTWLELFLTKGFPVNFGSTWAEHTAGYWALRDEPNVLVLFFADMKRDLPGTVQQVADVLGVRLTSAELHAVVERSTFSYMSSIEHKFTPIPSGTLPWGHGLKMMRAGNSGRSAELLSAEQRRRIDAHFAEELAQLGSDFPYSRFTGRDVSTLERHSRKPATELPA